MPFGDNGTNGTSTPKSTPIALYYILLTGETDHETGTYSLDIYETFPVEPGNTLA